MKEGLHSVESAITEFENSRHWFREYRLKNYLQKISDEQIIKQIGMAEMSKIVFILSKKYRKGIELIPIENDLMLRVGKTNIANMSYRAINLHFLNIENHVMHIEGNISVPAGLKKKYTFYAIVNGEKADVKLQDCGLDLKLGNEVYEIRTVFSMDLPLIEQQYVIEFVDVINEIQCTYSRINSLRFAPVADCIKGQYFAADNWVIQISGNQIVCCMSNAEKIAKYEKNYQREISLLSDKDTEWAVKLRQKYFKSIKQKKKPIWLIMDRSNRADDNGEVFFKYMQQHKEIETYFVIDKRCKDYDRLQAIGKVISLYSEEHYLLTLIADCVISSQCNGFVENPFWEKAEYFRDLYHRPKLIFLQHGVIKDDMSATLNRFHTNLAGFVTSTKAEYQSILEYPYYYDKENIWLTGLPILDELENKEERYIVIAPTWRKNLMCQQWDEEKNEMIWIPREDIRLSDYYKKYWELIHNPVLQECCKKHTYKLVFKPHPLMESYLTDIVESTDTLFMSEEMSYRNMLCKGSLMVTDYSSLAFEFAYLGKSTLYYQFDKKDFFAAHTYRQGYFDYGRDGFGEVIVGEQKLVQTLVKYIENNCVPKLKYKERMKSLSPYRSSVCDRVYEKIKEIIY